jgi:periplasmic divalent cation tolerance protein
MNKIILVETTCKNLRAAKNLGKILLEQKLAACVQYFEIKSSYFWEGKIQNDSEILVRIKSKKSLYLEIEKTIKNHHSYEIPQIFSIELNQGSEAYFNWVEKITSK